MNLTACAVGLYQVLVLRFENSVWWLLSSALQRCCRHPTLCSYTIPCSVTACLRYSGHRIKRVCCNGRRLCTNKIRMQRLRMVCFLNPKPSFVCPAMSWSSRLLQKPHRDGALFSGFHKQIIADCPWFLTGNHFPMCELPYPSKKKHHLKWTQLFKMRSPMSSQVGDV